MKFIPQFLAIIFVTTWLYVPLTRYYFFQDDFILFDMANRMARWQEAFAPSATIFWRPVAIGYFWLGQRVFGLDPYKFHLVSLATHIVNTLLVWVLVSRIFKSLKRPGPGVRQGQALPDSTGDVGWLSGLLFGTSAIHFMSQVWIGEFPIMLGLTFWLVTLIVELEWVKRPSWTLVIPVAFFYALGLLTHELTLFAPLVIVGFVGFVWSFRSFWNFVRRYLFQLLFMVLPGLLYLIVRLIVSPINISGTYEPVTTSESLKSVWWYLVWLTNIPEELKYQSFVPFSIRPEFAISFPMLTWLWKAQLMVIPLFGFVLPWLLAKRDDKKSMIHIAMIALFLSVSGGGILLVALGHQYPFLLTFPLVGVSILIALSLGLLIGRKYGAYFIGTLLFFWIFSSWSSLRFSEKSHWTVQEAEMAKRIVQAAKDQFGSFPPKSTLIVPLGIDGKHKAAMADQIGMRVIFKEQNLTTYYGTLQGILPPECVEVEDLATCLLKHQIYRIKV